MINNSKLMSLAGLAKKAGKLTAGHDAVLDSLRRSKSKLILLSADASERLENEMKRETQLNKSSAKVIRIKETMQEINRALPNRAAVLSVNDESFAAAMKKVIEED